MRCSSALLNAGAKFSLFVMRFDLGQLPLIRRLGKEFIEIRRQFAFSNFSHDLSV